MSNWTATTNSFLQIQAAFGVLRGSTVGVASSPNPVLPGPPSVVLGVRGAFNPPVFGARPNETLSIPQVNYAGSASGGVLVVPTPLYSLLQPSAPVGYAVLITNATETDMVQVTTFSIMGFSQGGGFLGPLLSAAASTSFALAGSGTGSQTTVLASGVPLLGGVLLPEDFDRGVIDHVLAVTWPQFRNQNSYYSQGSDILPSDFFAPCSSSDPTGSSWRQMALAAGQVLRLKPNGTLQFLNQTIIDESVFAPVTAMVLRAFRTYGVMPTRIGPVMSLVVESTETGSVSMSVAQAQALAGSRYKIVPTDGRGLWCVCCLCVFLFFDVDSFFFFQESVVASGGPRDSASASRDAANRGATRTVDSAAQHQH